MRGIDLTDDEVTVIRALARAGLYGGRRSLPRAKSMSRAWCGHCGSRLDAQAVAGTAPVSTFDNRARRNAMGAVLYEELCDVLGDGPGRAHRADR